jgi:hypothetical protein
MDIGGLLSWGLFGTFLVISSYPSLCFSHSTHELSSQLLARRQLKTTPDNTIQQYLIPHNALRAKLGLPPLTWSKKLANYASWWAHQRQGDCALIHSNSNYGENLFWGSGKDWKPGDAVEHGLPKEVTTTITPILVLRTKIACTIPRLFGGKA